MPVVAVLVQQTATTLVVQAAVEQVRVQAD
jgi:hypothetical protein